MLGDGVATYRISLVHPPAARRCHRAEQHAGRNYHAAEDRRTTAGGLVTHFSKESNNGTATAPNTASADVPPQNNVNPNTAATRKTMEIMRRPCRITRPRLIWRRTIWSRLFAMNASVDSKRQRRALADLLYANPRRRLRLRLAGRQWAGRHVPDVGPQSQGVAVPININNGNTTTAAGTLKK